MRMNETKIEVSKHFNGISRQLGHKKVIPFSEQWKILMD